MDTVPVCNLHAVLQREQAGCAGSSGDCHAELVSGMMHVDFTDDMHNIMDTSKGVWDLLRDSYTQRKHNVDVRTLQSAQHSAENIIEEIKKIRAEMALTRDTDATLQGFKGRIDELQKRLRVVKWRSDKYGYTNVANLIDGFNKGYAIRFDNSAVAKTAFNKAEFELKEFERKNVRERLTSDHQKQVYNSKLVDGILAFAEKEQQKLQDDDGWAELVHQIREFKTKRSQNKLFEDERKAKENDEEDQRDITPPVPVQPQYQTPAGVASAGNTVYVQSGGGVFVPHGAHASQQQHVVHTNPHYLYTMPQQSVGGNTVYVVSNPPDNGQSASHGGFVVVKSQGYPPQGSTNTSPTVNVHVNGYANGDQQTHRRDGGHHRDNSPAQQTVLNGGVDKNELDALKEKYDAIIMKQKEETRQKVIEAEERTLRANDKLKQVRIETMKKNIKVKGKQKEQQKKAISLKNSVLHEFMQRFEKRNNEILQQIHTCSDEVKAANLVRAMEASVGQAQNEIENEIYKDVKDDLDDRIIEGVWVIKAKNAFEHNFPRSVNGAVVAYSRGGSASSSGLLGLSEFSRPSSAASSFWGSNSSRASSAASSSPVGGASRPANLQKQRIRARPASAPQGREGSRASSAAPSFRGSDDSRAESATPLLESQQPPSPPSPLPQQGDASRAESAQKDAVDQNAGGNGKPAATAKASAKTGQSLFTRFKGTIAGKGGAKAESDRAQLPRWVNELDQELERLYAGLKRANSSGNNNEKAELHAKLLNKVYFGLQYLQNDTKTDVHVKTLIESHFKEKKWEERAGWVLRGLPEYTKKIINDFENAVKAWIVKLETNITRGDELSRLAENDYKTKLAAINEMELDRYLKEEICAEITSKNWMDKLRAAYEKGKGSGQSHPTPGTPKQPQKTGSRSVGVNGGSELPDDLKGGVDPDTVAKRQDRHRKEDVAVANNGQNRHTRGYGQTRSSESSRPGSAGIVGLDSVNLHEQTLWPATDQGHALERGSSASSARRGHQSAESNVQQDQSVPRNNIEGGIPGRGVAVMQSDSQDRKKIAATTIQEAWRTSKQWKKQHSSDGLPQSRMVLGPKRDGGMQTQENAAAKIQEPDKNEKLQGETGRNDQKQKNAHGKQKAANASKTSYEELRVEFAQTVQENDVKQMNTFRRASKEHVHKMLESWRQRISALEQELRSGKITSLQKNDCEAVLNELRRAETNAAKFIGLKTNTRDAKRPSEHNSKGTNEIQSPILSAHTAEEEKSHVNAQRPTSASGSKTPRAGSASKQHQPQPPTMPIEWSGAAAENQNNKENQAVLATPSVKPTPPNTAKTGFSRSIATNIIGTPKSHLEAKPMSEEASQLWNARGTAARAQIIENMKPDKRKKLAEEYLHMLQVFITSGEINQADKAAQLVLSLFKLGDESFNEIRNRFYPLRDVVNEAKKKQRGKDIREHNFNPSHEVKEVPKKVVTPTPLAKLNHNSGIGPVHTLFGRTGVRANFDIKSFMYTQPPLATGVVVPFSAAGNAHSRRNWCRVCTGGD